MTTFTEKILDHISVFNDLKNLEDQVNSIVTLCVKGIETGNKIILCGNGGSASDSQHIAGELVGRFTRERQPLPAISLNTDTSVITCIANDYSFSKIFSRQLKALGKTGDILFVLSTSGNSDNVLECCKLAKSLGIIICGFLGHGGGKIIKYCDVSLCVDSNNTATIQEAHIFLGHYICEQIEKSVEFNDT